MADHEGGRTSNNVPILALAAVLLGMALHLNDGLYSPTGVAVLLGSFVLALVGAFTRRGVLGSMPTKWFGLLLCVLIALQLLAMLYKPAGASAATGPLVSRRPFDAGLGIAVVAVALIGLGGPGVALPGFIVLLLAHASIGIWKIRTAPSPKMDVCVFHVDSAHALARGHNPYAVTFPNIYAPDPHVYGPDTVRDGRCLFGYPYMP